MPTNTLAEYGKENRAGLWAQSMNERLVRARQRALPPCQIPSTEAGLSSMREIARIARRMLLKDYPWKYDRYGGRLHRLTCWGELCDKRSVGLGLVSNQCERVRRFIVCKRNYLLVRRLPGSSSSSLGHVAITVSELHFDRAAVKAPRGPPAGHEEPQAALVFH
jgi:hypothetical protein